MENQSPFSGMDLTKAPPAQTQGFQGPRPTAAPQLRMHTPLPSGGASQGPFAHLGQTVAPQGIPPQSPIDTQNIMEQIRLRRAQPTHRAVTGNGLPSDWNNPNPVADAPFSADQLASINRAFGQYQQQNPQQNNRHPLWAISHGYQQNQPFNFTG